MALSPAVPAAPGGARGAVKTQRPRSAPFGVSSVGIIKAELQTEGLAVTQSRCVCVCVSVKVRPQASLRGRHPRWRAYLCLDLLPVVVHEPAATLPVQLLQDAAVDGQAVVNLSEKLVYVRVVGAEHALADLCELETGDWMAVASSRLPSGLCLWGNGHLAGCLTPCPEDLFGNL